MKGILFALSFFALTFQPLQADANVIIIKGHVKDVNGTPAINREVKIAVYLSASTTPCSEQVVVTDNAGFYSKELSCNGDIRRSRVAVKNCDGVALVQEKEMPSSKVQEVNFTVCRPAVTACTPKFSAEPVAASTTVPVFSVKFNSQSSEVSTGDRIARRTWDFRDGTPPVVDRVDPMHSFPRAGTYEVCLTIKTTLGCEKKVCKQVMVPASGKPGCVAKYTFESLGPNKFRFNSSSSVRETNDSITVRKWDFRDGTSSNDISPAHEFGKPGNYEVCLTIKTAKGCESRFCAVVKVGEAGSRNDAPIQIVSLYPSPVHETLKAVVFSARGNVDAIVEIVNQQGFTVWSKRIIFTEGYNPIAAQVTNLSPGTYLFKVKTRYGVVSKKVYKL